MEALLFMMDSLAIVIIVYMSLRDEHRDPGAPPTSLFRMKETEAAAPLPETTATGQRRARRTAARR